MIMSLVIDKKLTTENAIKMLNEILASDIGDGYKEVILEFMDDDRELDSDDIYEIAAQIAYYNNNEDIPEIAREYVLLAHLDAIAEGNEEAMLDLGSLYYIGRIGEQNYTKAIEYYTMAAELGNLIASENLGYCYYYGRDVEIDYKKAFECFIKPALAGRLESLYKIGDMYLKGLYVTEDDRYAFKLYEKAYRSIDEDCDVVGDICLRMGNSFYYGSGVERDYHTALFFYQQAELNYYIQIDNGDFFKKKMLADVINKINDIRERLKENI